MKVQTIKGGYTFLLSVLFIGAISIAVTGSLLLLGWLSLRNSVVMENSTRAFEFSQSCAEYALNELFQNSAYSGDEEIEYDDGTCYILPVGGVGYFNRTLCIEGTGKDTTRRLEIIINKLLPSIEIYAWQEVEFFTSCSYE